ncbi:MAG: hypothetical protein AAB969_01275, partial [Patescibacteria group bacterium]
NCVIINLNLRVDEFIKLCPGRILEAARHGRRQIGLKIHYETNCIIEFRRDAMMDIEVKQRFIKYIYSLQFLSKLKLFCEREGLKLKIISVCDWEEEAEKIVISW